MRSSIKFSLIDGGRRAVRSVGADHSDSLRDGDQPTLYLRGANRLDLAGPWSATMVSEDWSMEACHRYRHHWAFLTIRSLTGFRRMLWIVELGPMFGD